MEDRIKELESRVQFYDKLVYAAGAVALAFGIGGGFGLSTLTAVQKEITSTSAELTKIEEKILGVSTQADEIDNTVASLLTDAQMALENTVIEIAKDASDERIEFIIKTVLSDGVPNIKAGSLEIVDKPNIHFEIQRIDSALTEIDAQLSARDNELDLTIARLSSNLEKNSQRLVKIPDQRTDLQINALIERLLRNGVAYVKTNQLEMVGQASLESKIGSVESEIANISDSISSISDGYENLSLEVTENERKTLRDLGEITTAISQSKHPSILKEKIVEALKEGVPYIRTNDIEIFNKSGVRVGSFFAQEDSGAHLYLKDDQQNNTIRFKFEEAGSEPFARFYNKDRHFIGIGAEINSNGQSGVIRLRDPEDNTAVLLSTFGENNDKGFLTVFKAGDRRKDFLWRE